MGYLMEAGTKLELHRIRHVEKAENIVYISRFLYQKSEDEAVIAMPMKAGSVVALEPGEYFQVCFYTNKGIYRCQAQTTERFYEDGLPVAVIRFRSEFEKLQRRQYYRMECLIGLGFAEINNNQLDDLLWEKSETLPELSDEEEQTPANRLQYTEGVALDISGGGVRFNAGRSTETDAIIAMKILFPTDDIRIKQPLFAEVISCRQVPNHIGVFEHRVQFVHMTNMERESIIRYIFLEERKRRKKESGME